MVKESVVLFTPRKHCNNRTVAVSFIFFSIQSKIQNTYRIINFNKLLILYLFK